MAVAVMKKVPSSPVPPTAVRVLDVKVAKFVLLENQVAVEVISCPPLHVAVNVWLPLLLLLVRVMGPVGLTIGALVHATETVSGWVPVIEGRIFDVAVMVPVPTLCAVTSPPALIVATV